MLILRKKEITENKISYYYDPNGSGKEGIINYYPKDKVREVEKHSTDEYDCLGIDISHAFMAIQTYIRKNDFPEMDLIKW